ncbi:MAG: EAL domain-containing protein [Pseudomonadota bacterium]
MDPIEAKKSYKKGEVIMFQGDVGNNAYIIEEGRVEIIVGKPNGDFHSVGTRGPGTIIGEMAMVDDEPRTATIRALEDCKLLEITRNDFSRRLNNADPVIQSVAQVILTRYRDTLSRAEILKEPIDYPGPEELEKNLLEQSNAVEAIKMANDLKAAIDAGDQLYLHYQPIVSLKDGKVLGFEALMRWNHPEKGFISPNEFIPVAEDTGLIVDASRWALEESCNALKNIEGSVGYDHDLFMSVNFSSSDFAESNFLDHVYDIISKTDISPHKVHLEITERLLMGQPENAKKTLDLCRKAGLSISIDDFGTGYSSLSYLHYFPIDKLKIDRSFIKNMHDDANAMALVKSIISLADNMNMVTVAEGVETKEDVNIIRDLGCIEAQGFYFAKPMANQDIIELLKNWHGNELVA